MKKCIIFIAAIIILLLSPISISIKDNVIVDSTYEPASVEPFSYDSSFWNNARMEDTLVINSLKSESIIDNFTWAVMRYDFNQRSENHGNILVPAPSAGTVLVLADMMSTEVCRAAISVCKDNRRDTLEAFDEYVSSRMIHTTTAFTNGKDEWNTESCYNFRKESANEMNALGEICLKADLVGECYAQASFNTAMLRLAGFSAEDVFTVGIQSYQGGHAVNIVNVEDQWYIIDSTFADSVRMGMRDSVIFEKYFRAPITDYIVFLENDKYLVNFGTLYPQYIPTMKDPYLNMDVEMLDGILQEIRPLFNNSNLGRQKWEYVSFVENATQNPLMKKVAVPYTAFDAEGETIEEKTLDLSNRCKDFICNSDDGNSQDQYDKSAYAFGLLSVEYPQVYAKSATLAAWTSWYGIKRDRNVPFLDMLTTSLFTRFTMRTKQVVPEGCVAYSDLLYLRHAGSTIDKAVLSYGTLRNMKKDDDFWQPEDLFVLITEEYQGYLSLNINDNWYYMSFDGVGLFSNTAPPDIIMVFNEFEYYDSWDE